MMREGTWFAAWAPALGLTGVPTLSALLAIALVPGHIGEKSSASRPRELGVTSVSTEPRDVSRASDEEEPRSAPRVSTSAASVRPGKSRGFSPVREREEVPPVPSETATVVPPPPPPPVSTPETAIHADEVRAGAVASRRARAESPEVAPPVTSPDVAPAAPDVPDQRD